MVKINLEQIFVPVQRDRNSVIQRGHIRATALSKALKVPIEEFKGKRFLEIGCGFGETCAALIDKGADAVGVDLAQTFFNGPFKDKNFFRRIDATTEEMHSLGTFDYIVSYDCFEHIEIPELAIVNVAKLLKPGARAFLRFNLYRGPSASHLTSYIKIPWVHLIYSNDEIRKLMQREHGRDTGPAWVNKLTHLHYIELFKKHSLTIEAEWYREVDIEESFFQEHSEKLKAYPREDLKRDFMHVILRR